jgi:hypothetical protein
MERLAEPGWEFFMGLAPGNVFLAGLLKLISKGAEMLSVDIGESVRACSGKIRARD